MTEYMTDRQKKARIAGMKASHSGKSRRTGSICKRCHGSGVFEVEGTFDVPIMVRCGCKPNSESYREEEG